MKLEQPAAVHDFNRYFSHFFAQSHSKVSLHLAIAIWMIGCLPSATHAAIPFHLQLQVDKQSVDIAEPFHLTLTATAPAGWRIVMPEIPIASGDFEIIDSSLATDVVAERQVWKRQWVVEAYEAGQKVIPAIELTVEPASAEREIDSALQAPRRIRSEPVSIRVRSSLGPLESHSRLRPIDGPLQVPWTWWQRLLSLAVAAVLIACGLKIFCWLRALVHAPANSTRTALWKVERAREDWLRGLTDSSTTVETASVILRHWLQTRDATPEIERTTEGWTRWLEAHEEFDAVVASEVLCSADRVKFAGANPTIEEVRRILDSARTLIRSSSGKDQVLHH